MTGKVNVLIGGPPGVDDNLSTFSKNGACLILALCYAMLLLLLHLLARLLF